MGNDERDNSHATAELASDANDNNRQQQIDQLYRRHYSSIVDAAHEDKLLLPDDAEAIVATVTLYLPNYSGPLTDEGFLEWSRDVVRSAAKFYRIKRDAGDSIERGIRSVLSTCADLIDVRGFSNHDDRLDPAHAIESDVWLWVLQHLDELLKPGTAKLTTRLYARARWAARAWKTTRLRAKEKFVSLSNDGELEPTKSRDAVEV